MDMILKIHDNMVVGSLTAEEYHLLEVMELVDVSQWCWFTFDQQQWWLVPQNEKDKTAEVEKVIRS